MKENYQRKLEETLAQLTTTDSKPRLLLHSCCAPCSSYVLEYLSAYFEITVYYYNPNISPPEEFQRRALEQQRLIGAMPPGGSIGFLAEDYDPTPFQSLAQGLEDAPEGGIRCKACYELRLRQTALKARALGFDYFTTTLSISPHKDAQILNALGQKVAEECGGTYLFSDFKKKDGYRRSCALAEQYGLYRQDYCGCLYSRRDR